VGMAGGSGRRPSVRGGLKAVRRALRRLEKRAGDACVIVALLGAARAVKPKVKVLIVVCNVNA
jgi:hypothetical protein